MKDNQRNWKIASLILIMFSIGLVVLDVIGDSKVNLNGFEISNNNINNIEKTMEDNGIESAVLVNMETGKKVIISKLDKGDN
ncbi:MAG: hypothetical protein M0R17_10990 [Candidatus Omnitrophica bacterium]|jgi:hypothetical protein|nr:hypothetical protein [Candidatus Omnitrophota bacterium]